ncbi:MAG: protein kinase [Actinomycetota bacterium]
MIPDRIGRYQVHSVLGTGGFATVYLAHDPDLQAWVAIKVLADNMAGDAELRERFVSEARVMRQLQTPGLVTVYDIGEDNGRPYFVMEYCERGTLADRLDGLGRRLTVPEAVELARAIAICTGHIHRAGMVHRDLKPSNYLIRVNRGAESARSTVIAGVLGPDEELAVADFGLAKVVDPHAAHATMAGGTPGYGAPEQFRGDASVSASADVYAASALIVAAVSGTQPQPLIALGQSAFADDAMAATGPLATELQRGLAVRSDVRHRDIDTWFGSLSTALTTPGGAPVRPRADASYQTVAAPPSAPGSLGSMPPPVVPDRFAGQPTTAARHSDAPNPASTPAPGPAPAQYTPAGQAHPPTTSAYGAPAGYAASPQAPTDSFQGAVSAPGRRSRLPLLVVLGVVTVAVVGGLALLATQVLGGDGAITGPTTGPVGQEVAFTTTDGAPATWTVGGDEFVGTTIAVTPGTEGWVEVTATQGDGADELVFTATAPDAASVVIVGPAAVTVGQAAVFTAPGVEDGAWTVNGESFTGAAVEITPSSPGTIEIGLEAGDDRVTRVVTVAAGP